MYPKKCVSLTIPNILSDDRETRILTKKHRSDRSFFPPIAIVPATEPARNIFGRVPKLTIFESLALIVEFKLSNKSKTDKFESLALIVEFK